MSNRKLVEVLSIHPVALKELGEEACLIALGVAHDLRSGVIPPDEYNQGEVCGTACCIAGHIVTRLWGKYDGPIPRYYEKQISIPALRKRWYWYEECRFKSLGLARLFGGLVATPQQAADAIENYLHQGSSNPWNH